MGLLLFCMICVLLWVFSCFGFCFCFGLAGYCCVVKCCFFVLTVFSLCYVVCLAVVCSLVLLVIGWYGAVVFGTLFVY